MATLKVDLHVVDVHGLNYKGSLRRQLEVAINFFANLRIPLQVTSGGKLTLQLPKDRALLGLSCWAELSKRAIPEHKGCDLFVLPGLEPMGGDPAPFGLTILPGKTPPEGIPQQSVQALANPNPTRPAVILNLGQAMVPDMTLTHELGHVLLNTSKHHLDLNNFMFAHPPQLMKFDATQIARMACSPWAV